MKSFSLLTFLLLAACKPLGPDHQTPVINLPVSFSNGGVDWTKRSPDSLPKPRSWWKLYNDGTLDGLVEQALANNQELTGAAARVKQARALSRAARGRYFPSIDIGASASRSKSRDNGVENNVSVPGDLSYELDVWGKVRRQVESANALADASQENFSALRLTVVGEVAQTYWALRAVDADRDLLARTIELRRKGFDIMSQQEGAGSISALDLSRARGEVATAEAEKYRLDQDRIELQNAIAVLTGRAAGGLSLPAKTELPGPPSVPVSLPSEVLLQRPDIRAAERRVAAANADIGASIAAYYPSFQINGSGGFSAGSGGQLFKSSALVWAIGPNVSVPIVDQKFLRDRRDAAIAAHEAAGAEYRQIVLDAVREVENALQASSVIVRRQSAQNEATAAARETADLSTQRYDAGLVGYLDVVDAERTRLEAERLGNAVRAERLALSVQLAKAVGGEW
ncbi:efflux transporter outer membrane subunit [Luteolibacter yonseiensis]|uniref:Efflux transporter outer membrane subunit n=1 Tax=Luteolibacter yonseiensis TaxID=1144680 RepID=A0A934R292_9BACT|nr:efflux transporter outer membrane subunit [Luteolibacter yonseiensis]MBK1815504.1 efflux transporter outer membrane subunit [Luteolibacter yonseiensis]